MNRLILIGNCFSNTSALVREPDFIAYELNGLREKENEIFENS